MPCRQLCLIIGLLAFMISPFAVAAAGSIPRDARKSTYDSPPEWLKTILARAVAEEETGGPPVPPTDFDVTHYDLDLTLDFDTESLAGAVEITARSLIPDLSLLRIDLRENMSVDEVTRDGETLAFAHPGDRITIVLDRIFGFNEEFTVRIAYSGQPLAEGFQCFVFGHHDGRPIASTLSEPWYAPNWWPCKEDPSDKATADLRFTVPSTMIAASNGTLVDTVDHGETKMFHWRSSYPIATYLVSVAATNYANYSEIYVTADGDSMPVEYYAYPEDLVGAIMAWDEVVAHIEFFRNVFGEYPFLGEKYGIVEQVRGAIEHQTLTGLPSYNLDSEFVLIHELAHQWWGDMVTCASWNDIWLNEGFATYSTALWYDDEQPGGAVEFLRSIDDEGGFTGSIYRDDISGIGEIFDSIVYDKGAWALHMLRGILGDDDFFDGLASYREAFAYASATTDQFQNVIEDFTGRDFDWFFNAWIYGEGRPDYEYSWWQPDPEGPLTLVIDQVQPTGTIFTMPIEIDVVTIGGTERFTVWDSLDAQVFQLDVSAPVLSLDLDPDDWILDWHEEVPTAATDSRPRRNGHPTFVSVRPSPFVSDVELGFHVPNGQTGDRTSVDLAIYDIGGRRVRALFSGTTRPGPMTIEWDGDDDDGHAVGGGVYFVLLQSGNGADVRRIVKVE